MTPEIATWVGILFLISLVLIIGISGFSELKKKRDIKWAYLFWTLILLLFWSRTQHWFNIWIFIIILITTGPLLFFGALKIEARQEKNHSKSLTVFLNIIGLLSQIVVGLTVVYFVLELFGKLFK